MQRTLANTSTEGQLVQADREYWVKLEPYMCLDSSLSLQEKRAYRLIKSILLRKIGEKKFNIDMPRLKEHLTLSEVQARKLINKFEFEEKEFGTQFFIINGSDVWKEEDAVRATKVSKRHSSML